LSSRMESGFDILEDILKNSIFPEDELIRIKKKIVASIKEEDKDIFDRGMNALRVLLYGKNPYSMRISGEIGTVGNMSRERVMSFYQGQVIPEGSVITVVGDVDIEGVVTDLKERFSGWDREKEAAPVNDLEPIREEKRIDLDMEKEQALFMCGFQGVKMDDEKKYPLSIISALLSGSDGLLFFSAREEMGIAYASGALNVPAVDPGYFLLYLATTEEDLSSAEEAVFKALAKVRRGEIEDDDITASKNRLITQSALSLETNSAVSLRMALDELYGLGYEDYKRYPEKIRNVSKKDIENVSGEILMTARSAVVLVHSTRAER
ncbi:MAG: insulinase family protein, partial [Candidatus Omnitrophica bacterium]|nr:insulinase family protein [Candidatus Omnitrophota bacterium]